MSDEVIATTVAAAKPEDSLRKRYFGKVGFNLAGLPVSWAIQAIVPRVLGPAEFGNFSFVTSFFTTVVSFADAGTSTKLYNRLCQQPEDTGVLRFYWGFVAKATAVLLFLVILCIACGLGRRLWPEQPASYVMLGVLYGLSIWAINIGGRVIDAYGLTVKGEIARLLQKVVTLGLISVLFVVGWLSLPSLFVVQFLVFGLLLLLWNCALRQSGSALLPKVNARVSSGRYGREFWQYSHPLLLGGVVGTLETIADRWLLQYFGSSVEQGLFALSYQVGALCFLFSGAAVPLLAREFSQAHFAGDTDRMARAFSVQVPRLYALSAFIGVFFASQADTVALLFGGARYAAATIPTLLMCIYPLHQTYGQLTASVFFAIAETRLYRNIGVIGSLAGIACTYLALAPRTLGGLGMGSIGLSLKMLAVQFTVVNVQLWFCARLLHIRFLPQIASQVLVVCILGAAATMVRLAVPILSMPSIVHFVVCGLCYTALVLVAVWMMPAMFGWTRAGLRHYLVRALGLLRNSIA